MKAAIRTSLISVTALLAPCWAFGGSVIPGFELVYTLPVETTLGQPDLRQAADVWREMVAGAKKRVDFCQFYITPKDGEPLDPVLAEMEAAAKRGVKIRFLAESKMAKASAEGFERLRKIPNLELRVVDFGAVKKDGIIHAKYFVVDGREAYLGSQNFDWRSLKHIHELGLRISKARIVRDMAAVFEADWAGAARAAAGKAAKPLRKVRPAADFKKRAYLVASPWAFNPLGVGDSESELVRLIDSAKKELLIQVLDYAPLTRTKRFYPPLDNALRSAAARGVQVRLLVSNWNAEHPEVDHLKSLSLVPGVEVRMATLPQAAEGHIPFSRVIHSKYMVLDGELLWLGTSNWSGGYLDNSRNLEVVIKDESLAGKAAAVHRQLWESAYAEKLDPVKEYPKPRR
ncbi:MAG: phospholipase D-like domain-containing protein [Elusimicrobiota bacterium]|jgi:phosphatidylserine/phosphatidylglycerophosphate/cardiolipin synthase-like enzyme